MRITEGQLRKIVRGFLLTEAAQVPDDLPEGMVVAYYGYVPFDGSGVTLKMIKDIEEGIDFDQFGPDQSPTGFVSFNYADDINSAQHDPGGLNPIVVVNARATNGWGPLLYDVAMELSWPNGIMADRETVSKEAFAVWDYYMNSRPDVEAVQFDDENDTLTPVPEDNISQYSAEVHSKLPEEWPSSPLSKAYRKKGGATPTIDRLKSLGKWVEVS